MVARPIRRLRPEAGIDGGRVGDLERELAEYEAFRDAALIEATGIGECATAMIRARIVSGLTRHKAKTTGTDRGRS